MLADCIFKLEKVGFDDILFVEAEGRYAMLHTTTGRKFAIRMPLAELEAKLPGGHFARTHRSFLIHLKWLQSVDPHEMTAQVKEKHVPLSLISQFPNFPNLTAQV